MKIVKKLWNNKLLMTILITLLLSCIFILPQTIKGGGVFSLVADFNQEQIPFNEMSNKLIKEGNVFYNYYNGMGTGFIESYSFYVLGSPFFYLSLLFKASTYKYLVAPLLILKFIVAAIISFLFLNRYFKNENYVMLGAILYAFCGFQLISIQFYHFLDVTALFPLLLWSLDKLMIDKKKGLFLISVFANCLVNYYFFIGEVIFVFLYYIVKVFSKEYKFTIKSFITIFIELVLGVLTSSIILIPSLLICLGNPRTELDNNLRELISYPLTELLILIKSIFFPPEAMTTNSLILISDYSSKSLYLPFISTIPFLSYIINKPKKWVSILAILCLIISYFPFLNGIFTLYSTLSYTRWHYMFILIIVLISLKAIEEKINFKKGYLATFILVLFFIINSIMGMQTNIMDKIIVNNSYFIINLIIISVSLIIIYFLNKSKNDTFKYYFIGTLICIPLTGLSVIHFTNDYFYKVHGIRDNNYTYKLKDKIKIDKSLNNRVDYTNYSLTNIPLMLEKPSMNIFNSVVENSTYDFYKKLGIKRVVESLLPIDSYYLASFMNIKYVVSKSSDKIANKELSKKYNINYKDNQFIVYETDNNLNYGVFINNYISKKEFKKLSKSDRYKVITNTVVLDDKDIKKYKLNKYTISEDYDEVLKNINTGDMAKLGSKSITKKITSDSDGIVVMQFSYSDDWNVTVNGKKKELLNVDNGLMGVYVNKGTNNIKFTYNTDKYKYSMILSIIGLIFSTIYIILVKKKDILN